MSSYDSICNVFFFLYRIFLFDGCNFLADCELLQFIRILLRKDMASTVINLQQKFFVIKCFFR